jgi:transposase
MPEKYLLGDKAWATIEPLLPTVYDGERRHDDRRIISGIVHVLRSGCRRKDGPAIDGPTRQSIIGSIAGAAAGELSRGRHPQTTVVGTRA